VPRDVDPECADLPNVFVADIDDLQKLADEHQHGRRGEAVRAEAMVEQEVARFLEAFRGRRVGPTIIALREKVLEVARGEAERAVAAMPGLGERERRAMLELAEGIAKKLLHNPQVALKKGGGDPVDGAILLSAVHRLFNLEVADVPVAATGADADGEATTPQTNARGTGKATGS
jgi:glutamyl-tRNA reductase